jgi:hypothetical protein
LQLLEQINLAEVAVAVALTLVLVVTAVMV